MRKEVCIIIPCYKSLDTIERLLLSIANQTTSYFDTYLAIDGDNLKDEYEYLANRYRCKVLYFDENLGAGMTRQRVLDKIQSKYKYVMFADSDDMLNPRAVETLYRAITNTDSDIAYSNIIRTFKDGSAYIIDVNDKESKAISWCVGKMYRIKFLYKKKIKFRKELRLNEDIYYNFVAFNLTDKVVKVSEVTYIWLYNPDSTTTKDKSKKYKAYNIQQSILSSTLSIIDLARKKHNTLNNNILVAKLLNIYTISQEAIYYGISLKCFEEEYDMLSKEINVYEFVKDNIDLFMNRLNQVGYTLDSEYYLYEQSFIEFIKFAYNIKKGGK
jgi:glycosyltransferase involved in cell wall biosynthesis